METLTLQEKLRLQSTYDKYTFVKNMKINLNKINKDFKLEIDIDKRNIKRYSNKKIENYIGGCFNKFKKIYSIDKTKISKKTIQEMFKKAGYHINSIPKEYHTYENILIALKTNGCALDNLDKNTFTTEMLEVAISSGHNMVIQFIPKKLQTIELVLQYLNIKDEHFYKSISKKILNIHSEKIYEKSVKSYEYNFTRVPNSFLTDDKLKELFFKGIKISYTHEERINKLISFKERCNLYLNKQIRRFEICTNISLETKWIKENIKYLSKTTRKSLICLSVKNFKKDFFNDIDNLSLLIDNNISVYEELLKAFDKKRVEEISKKLYIKTKNDVFLSYLTEKDYENLDFLNEKLTPSHTVFFLRRLPNKIQDNEIIVNKILKIGIDKMKEDSYIEGIYGKLWDTKEQRDHLWYFVQNESTLLLLANYGFRFEECPKQFQTNDILEKLKLINNEFIINDKSVDSEKRYELEALNKVNYFIPEQRIYDVKKNFEVNSLIEWLEGYRGYEGELQYTHIYISNSKMKEILENTDKEDYFYINILYYNNSLVHNPNYSYHKYDEIVEKYLEDI